MAGAALERCIAPRDIYPTDFAISIGCMKAVFATVLAAHFISPCRNTCTAASLIHPAILIPSNVMMVIPNAATPASVRVGSLPFFKSSKFTPTFLMSCHPPTIGTNTVLRESTTSLELASLLTAWDIVTTNAPAGKMDPSHRIPSGNSANNFRRAWKFFTSFTSSKWSSTVSP